MTTAPKSPDKQSLEPAGAVDASGGTLARGAALVLLSEASILPAGLISAAILTRGLGVEGYGWLGLTYALVGPVSWILAGLLAGRTAVKLVLSAPDADQMMSKLLRLNLMIGCTCWILFASAMPWVSVWVGNPELAIVLALAGSEILLLPLARLHRDVLSTSSQYSRSGVATGIFQLARLLLILILVPLGFGLTAVVFAIAAARLVEIWWCRSKLPIALFRPSPGLSIPWRETVGFLFVYELCQQLISRHDIIFLSILGGSSQDLGFYAAARIVAMAPELFAFAFVPMLISALVVERKQRRRAKFHTLLKRNDQIAAVGAGLTVATLGASESICIILFGQAFAPAAPLYAFLAFAAAAAFVQNLAVAHLVARDRFALPAKLMVPLLLATLCANMLIIPEYGALGAAAVVAGMRTIGALIAITLLPRPHGKRIRTLAGGVLCGVVGACAAFYLPDSFLPGVDLFVALTMTALGMGLLRVVQPRELSDLFQELSKIRQIGSHNSARAGPPEKT